MTSLVPSVRMTRGRQIIIIIIKRLRGMILYPHMHHRKSEHQPTQKQSPSRIEYTRVSGYHPPHRMSTNPIESGTEEGEGITHETPAPSALQTPAAPADCIDLSRKVPHGQWLTRYQSREYLTESSEVRQPLGRIRHGPDQPIRRGLPHRVQQPKHDIKEQTRDVSVIPDSQFLRFGGYTLSRVRPNQLKNETPETQGEGRGETERSPTLRRTFGNTTPKYALP